MGFSRKFRAVIVVSLLALTAGALALPAHADDRYRHRPPPRHDYHPRPVYVAPAPVYGAPPPVVYAPPPVVASPGLSLMFNIR